MQNVLVNLYDGCCCVFMLVCFLCTVKDILSITDDINFVLEEDGSEIVEDVLTAIFEDNEKIGTIMVLKTGEAWHKGDSKVPGILLIESSYLYAV